MARWIKGGMDAAFLALFLLTVTAFLPWFMEASAVEREEKVKSPGGEQALVAKSRAMGTVKVLVRVRLQTMPGGPGNEAVDKERAIREGQDRVLSELAQQGLTPAQVYKYKFIPFVAMTVDLAILNALLSSPNVESVEEDVPVPTNRGP